MTQPHGLTAADYTIGEVEANGLVLRYLDYGTAGEPPVLCVHGGGAHAHWFDYTAGAFTGEYHVRSIDLRGHGDSAWGPSYRYADYAADLDAAVRSMDLKDFVLVGHSMGGMVSLIYAAAYPGRVSKLIVVDTQFNLAAERVALLRTVGSKPGSLYASRDELVARYRLRPGHSIASPAIVEHIASHSGREEDDGSWRLKFDRAVYATREPHDGLPYWVQIKVPALLVRGAESERISDAIYAEVRARCPQAELATVNGAHHHVMLDKPEDFAVQLTAFLRRNA